MSTNQILAVSLFFHLSATVVWVGGLVITAALVWPELRRGLEDHPALYRLLDRLRKRFAVWSNLSLAVLIVTGLTQMSLDPNYDGLMQFDNEWSRVLLVKHLVIVVMVASGITLQYGIAPALERATLLAEHGRNDPAEWQKLRRREIRLTWLNVLLGIGVLGLSAWAGSI